MRTLREIMEQLKQLDEVLLLELLGANSEDLVERFADVIEDNYDRLNRELEQFFETDEAEETEES
jgi:hypothetical protein